MSPAENSASSSSSTSRGQSQKIKRELAGITIRAVLRGIHRLYAESRRRRDQQFMRDATNHSLYTGSQIAQDNCRDIHQQLSRPERPRHVLGNGARDLGQVALFKFVIEGR